jgi:mono/diheme cytochrome c family protein
MKTPHKLVLLFLPLFLLFLVYPFQTTLAQQSATPTYDPLAEPPLPPNPTEYELGRNLYWHWCMTCHGDRGQGLTDEFRSIWPPEHQNCWGRGCHTGRPGETGFPIPTVVPALVNEAQLRRFASRRELADFLQATHPPQSPGVLKREEYQAIALFVFTLNGRMPEDISATETPIPTPSLTLFPSRGSGSGAVFSAILLLAITLTIIFIILIKRTARSQR